MSIWWVSYLRISTISLHIITVFAYCCAISLTRFVIFTLKCCILIQLRLALSLTFYFSIFYLRLLPLNSSPPVLHYFFSHSAAKHGAAYNSLYSTHMKFHAGKKTRLQIIWGRLGIDLINLVDTALNMSLFPMKRSLHNASLKNQEEISASRIKTNGFLCVTQKGGF